MALTAQHMYKTYKKRTVVNNTTLSLHPGEIVGLLGPNGAGKTTSFYAIAGSTSLDAGHIFLDDQEITHLPLHARARLGIGYLPQEASIFRKMSVEDNIAAVLELRQDLNSVQRDAELEHLLHDFHLTHIRQTLGIACSGGERRRVEIARALAAKPKYILLDEPFAGVDPISVLDIKRQIQQLIARNLGVLITDHNVRETLSICHRAYIMNLGSVIAEGRPDVILMHEQVRAVYLGDDFML